MITRVAYISMHTSPLLRPGDGAAGGMNVYINELALTMARRDIDVIAHLGPSDMRGAIGYALNWPERLALPVDRIDFTALGRLEFAAADPERFPALRLARQVLAYGGLAGAVFNAAKEAALDAFIQGEIGFLDMAVLVEHVLDELGPEAAEQGPGYDLAAVTALDAAARRMGEIWVRAFRGKG